MRYDEWLELLHPSTKAMYEGMMRRKYGIGKPTFVVWMRRIHRKNDPERYREVREWIEQNCRRQWYDLSGDFAHLQIVGFDDEEDAMMFKLAYGDGYDPRSRKSATA